MQGASVTAVGSLEVADTLEARFDATSGGPQLVALVSPTCEVCLDGVAMVLQGLDEPAGRGFEVHVVWTPVLHGDSSGVAEEVARTRRNRRVQHYWDATKSISDAARVALDLASWGRTVAWDVYLLYRAGVRWSDPFPPPTTWLHQLRIEDRPSLDADSLRVAMQALTSRDST
jgi:hypothetical protein